MMYLSLRKSSIRWLDRLQATTPHQMLINSIKKKFPKTRMALSSKANKCLNLLLTRHLMKLTINSGFQQRVPKTSKPICTCTLCHSNTMTCLWAACWHLQTRSSCYFMRITNKRIRSRLFSTKYMSCMSKLWWTHSSIRQRRSTSQILTSWLPRQPRNASECIFFQFKIS